MTSRAEPIDLTALHRAVTAPYWNGAVATVNGHELRLSVMTAPFGWHSHPDSDESVLVLEGELIVGFADRDVVLKPGELLTVPRGVVHRTRPGGARSVNVTFERKDAATMFLDAP